MRESIALSSAAAVWDPEERLFDDRARPPGPSREEKEALSAFLDRCAGPRAPFGLLVERDPGLSGERISGFSMSEIVRPRGRIHVAIVAPARTEEIMVPVVATLTSVPMACFHGRAEARRWIREAIAREAVLAR